MSIIDLAKKSVSKYVKSGERYDGPFPEKLKSKRAGVFVTLKKDGELRGCIGTIEATEDNLAEEIISNSIQACKDPRFSKLKAEELDNLKYEVSVLKKPTLIKKGQTGIPKEITDPKKEGIIVSSGHKKGLLLPNIDGVESSKEQLKIALKKGGINPDRPYDIYKFETQKYAGM